MPDPRNLLAPTTAASILVLTVFATLYADPLMAKDRRTPQQDQPPRFRYIHCAAALGDFPCSLDPAMQHLEGFRFHDPSRLVPTPDPPVFAPTR